MKLFNAIAVFDVYVAAETAEEARAALAAWLIENKPSEIVAVEASREAAVRDAWRAQSPLVAGDVSDEDFKLLKGKNTLEIHALIYKKNPS